MPNDALLWLEVRWNPKFNKALTISGPYTNSDMDRLLLQFHCNRIRLGVAHYGENPMPHDTFDFIMTDPNFHKRLDNFRDYASAKKDQHVFHMNVGIERVHTAPVVQALRGLPLSTADLSYARTTLHTARTLTVRPEYPYPIDATWFSGDLDERDANHSPWKVTETRTFLDLDEAKEHATQMIVNGKEAETDQTYDLEYRERKPEGIPGWWVGMVKTEKGNWIKIVSVDTQPATNVLRHTQHY